MKIYVIIFAFIGLPFCDFTFPCKSSINSPKDICEYISSTKSLNKMNFGPDDHDKVIIKNFQLIDKLIYPSLYNQDKPSSDSNYIYGKLKISKTRIALICFNKTIECDQNIDYFSLHIIDDCAKTKDVITLSLNDGHCGIFYQVSSSISKNLDRVTIIEQSTSEWLVGTKSDFDTLFTTSYKINMRSKNLDTLQKTTTYQIIKQ